MKKLIFAAVLVAALGSGASAWFDGGLGMTTGPDGYSRTDAYLTIGGDSMWVKPALLRQDADGLANSLNTYSVRVGKDAPLFTVAGEAGMTPATEYSAGVDYSNVYFGGDITFSLTPSGSGKGRLAGPNSRVTSGGGEGITQVDVGAGLKHTLHKAETSLVDSKAGQTEFSVFAGAKVLMARLGGSWTGYKYGDDDVFNRVNTINGQALALIGALPKSSVNVRLDIPATIPMVTPFASYTRTQFKGDTDDASAYGFGAYVDLNMVGANVAYQILDDGSSKDSYVSISAGLKF
jgi:hypothetical protein